MKNIVIDDGSTQIKIAYRDDSGSIVSLVTSSRGENKLLQGADWTKFAEGAFRCPEGEYTIGENLESPIPSNIPSHQTSALARCAVHDALRKAGFGGKDVSAIVTLPVGRYSERVNGEAVNKVLIEEKKKAITGQIESAAGEKLATIKKVEVAPEAIPAFIDFATNDNCEWKDGYGEHSQVVTIDIGGTTTDVAVFEGKGMIKSAKSISIGVMDVSESVSTALIRELNASSIRPQWVEEVIRGKHVGGKDFSQILKQCRQPVFAKIVAELERIIPNPDQFDLVLAIGGGAELFKDELKQWAPTAVIPDNPTTTVARGILKIKGETA